MPNSIYQPPYRHTPLVLNLLVEIGEWIGRYQSSVEGTLTPQLRRGNRIRTIHASLAIENNTLTLEQVTDVLDGKRVMGLPREIQEVRNAFAAYEKLTNWDPCLIVNFLEAHSTMTSGLIDETGKFRSKKCRYLSGERTDSYGSRRKNGPQTNERPYTLASKNSGTSISCQLCFSL